MKASTTSSTTSSTTVTMDKYGFTIPIFPTCCPPIHNQTDIISIVVGNTHYTWSYHASYDNEFVSTQIWRTLPLYDSDNMDDMVVTRNGNNHTDTSSIGTIHNNTKKLVDYIPSDTLERLFGSTTTASVVDGNGSSTTATTSAHTNNSNSNNNSTNFSVSNAKQYRLTQKRIPYIYIYVISTNVEHASTILSLFHGIPTIIYRLSNKDFLFVPNTTTTATTSEGQQQQQDSSVTTTTLYAGIGVDRVANIAGAKAMFSSSSTTTATTKQSPPILVIDGGTALTYTTTIQVPEKNNNASTSTTTINYVNRIGGGISPGLQMRFRALFDYSIDVPFVKTSVLLHLLNECTRLQQPLLLFTTTPTPTTSDGNTGSTNVDENDDESDAIISRSIIACVMTEMALLLCSTIRKWLDVISKNDSIIPQQEHDDTIDPRNIPIIVLTGGDCEIYDKLLQRHHSYICETNDSNIELLNRAIHEHDDSYQHVLSTNNSSTTKNIPFRIKVEKSLQHRAISNLLVSHISSLRKNENMNEMELVRDQLIGLRIAVDSSNRTSGSNSKTKIGTIVSVHRNVTYPHLLDEDIYLVIYDGEVKAHSLRLREIYDALLLFVESPPKLRDEKGKIGVLNRKKDAEEAIAALQLASPTIQQLIQSQKPVATSTTIELNNAVAPDLTVEQFDTIMSSTKRKPALAATELTMNKRSSVDPHSFIGKRIGKFFELDDDQGNKVMSLFFGTVMDYVKKHEWWHIEYEDGDSEDMSITELKHHLAVYEENKASDTS